jgi:hypothetical protein
MRVDPLARSDVRCRQTDGDTVFADDLFGLNVSQRDLVARGDLLLRNDMRAIHNDRFARLNRSDRYRDVIVAGDTDRGRTS